MILQRVLYLAAAILVILGLKSLSSPATAKHGNTLAGVGLGLAVLATFVTGVPHNLAWILVALALGSALGAWGARAVRMTDMPQMVALLNGLGGGAAALVSSAEFLGAGNRGGVSVLVGTLIGAVSFSGSLVAFGKLQGLISEKALVLPGGRAIHAATLVSAIALGAWATNGGGPAAFGLFALAALLLGVVLVVPVGGADMPVVISILNSFTGLAAAATGFVLQNPALLISGTLVGASGTLLTQLMCKAMNRSLGNVLFGAMGAEIPASAAGPGAKAARPVRDLSIEDAAVLLSNVGSLIIVPGYGMAVAQAQHVTRELADLLAARGVDVKYAIHPVAGRMPGHMNVLLAEANVPYSQLFDLEQINSEFERTDVALVIGANDVVNPAARHDKASPIYGMPILDADKARHVLLIKRSLNAGFAGIDNELYYDPRTSFVFGDARQVLSKLVEELKHTA
ncbi:MAG: NAD(P)(+) transhydrogenase (Re/Si-specific) subunit beta [Candidatus Eisenbacteria bacterium]